MDENQDQSQVALKIVFILSLLLVSMDIFEIYLAYNHLKYTSQTIDVDVFETCIKYHIIAKMFFILFAAFAGLSACIMSLGLLINYSFFAVKFIDTFLYWNYLFFGPYLLAVCSLGYLNFDNIAFNCDPKDITKRYFNFSIILALIICFMMSVIITFGYSLVHTIYILNQSVRFTPDGNRLLGRFFWNYVLYRSDRMPDSEQNDLAIPLNDINNPQIG